MLRTCSLLLASLLGCIASPADTGADSAADTGDTGTDSAGDSDTDTDTDSDTEPDSASDTDTAVVAPCDPTATFTGSLVGTWWSGPEVNLSLTEPDRGAFSHDCYGGYIEDDLVLDGTAFDWSARFHVGAGSPEQRPIRAVGCVTDTQMELSIVEEDGTTYWGPWLLDRSATKVSVELCD